VRAPHYGVVTNVMLAEGQFVGAGNPALTFIDADAAWVTVDLRENQLQNIENGDAAHLLFDAVPGKIFEGRAQSIAWGIDPGRNVQGGLVVNQPTNRWFEPARRIPAPTVIDDPLYAVRLGLTGTLAYAAIPIINPALPPIIAALPVGLIAAPIVIIVLVYAMTWLVEQLRPMPLVYVGAMWLTYFAAFRMILKTGAPAGMLIIIVAVLMSVMGMNGTATVETMRDGFVQAALVTGILGPVVYLLLPAAQPRCTSMSRSQVREISRSAHPSARLSFLVCRSGFIP